ncbi:hypothetical protein LTR94_030266, partial [Friedmanniomyces endolithicus]
LPEMVLFRVIQGIAAAFINPLSQTAMLDINPPERHARAMSIWGMGIMIGPIVGPVLGGWLTEQANWRWVFYVNLPFGLLTLGLWHEFQRSESLRRAAADSFDRRIAAVALLSELKDAETAQRGFILTGDETFLEPYAPSRREIIDYLHRMDRPEQHGAAPWMHTLHILVESKFEELDRTIALVRAGREDQARAIVREGAGKRVMDRLRDVVATIVRDDRAVADAA